MVQAQWPYSQISLGVCPWQAFPSFCNARDKHSSLFLKRSLGIVPYFMAVIDIVVNNRSWVKTATRDNHTSIFTTVLITAMKRYGASPSDIIHK
jgi:hypothetical protein